MADDALTERLFEIFSPDPTVRAAARRRVDQEQKRFQEISIDREAATAAAWWGNQLRIAGDHDVETMTGDQLALAAALMPFAGRRRPTEQQIRTFEAHLRAAIPGMPIELQEGKEPGTCVPERALHSRYGPQGILAEAAQAAGIHINSFPWNRHLIMQPGSVVGIIDGRRHDVPLIDTGKDYSGPSPEPPGL